MTELEPAMPQGVGARIMVIDDDATLLQSVKKLLERLGHTVSVHEGGPGCCNTVAEFKPNLVLVDLKMPFLSGDAFIWLFRPVAGMNKAAIVLFSGVDEAILERKAHECGAHGYIPKSVSSLELARRVASYLQLATAASD